jgi:hypothetical protein
MHSGAERCQVTLRQIVYAGTKHFLELGVVCEGEVHGEIRTQEVRRHFVELLHDAFADDGESLGRRSKSRHRATRTPWDGQC